MAMIILSIGEWVIGILVLLGAFLSLVSTLGLIRMPDVYLRSHAASKSTTLGTLSILFAAFLFFWFKMGHVSMQLLLAILFVFLTSPVSGHLNSRAAYRTGVRLWKGSTHDDLKEVVHQGTDTDRSLRAGE
jgi:multicomponent Na+:H+ antiporter subunit G